MIEKVLKLLQFLPVKKNRICLLCFDGSKIGWDAKAIVDYVNDNHLNYEMVWLVKGKEQQNAFHLDHVQFRIYKSLAGIIALMTSKYVIYNIRVPQEVPFRKEQVLINTWHGFAFKKVGKYTDGFSLENLNRANAMTSHAAYYTEHVLKDSFEFKGDILTCGVPRNDIFFSDSRKRKAAGKAREELGIPADHKVVLYAPTFREGNIMPESQLNIRMLKESLQQRFGGTWDVVYRLHPIAKKAPGLDLTGCIDGSDYDDMQELLCLADVLITDYSSSMWDFSLQYKPVFLFADDVDAYEQERGFEVSIKDTPYIIAQNNEEMRQVVLDFDEEQYRKNTVEFFEKMGCFDEGKACQMIFDYIKDRS